MVKKILFTIAVVAFLTASVQALDVVGTDKLKYDGMWPYTWTPVPVCTIKVYMDVGYFVQVKDCGDRKIKLVQVPCADIGKEADKFPCYDDCEEFKIRANFEVKLGGNLINKVSWLGDSEPYYLPVGDASPDVVPAGPGPSDGWHVRKVCVKAWNVKIWDAPNLGDEVQVAKLEITVKPNALPSVHYP